MTIRSPHSSQDSGAARPARDVFLALAVKGILLLAIYLLFFGPAHRPAVDADATATAVVGAHPIRDVR
jgi:hypothetical protein